MNAVKRVGSKVYIEDVPRMSWDTGEMCEFASAFVRAARCIDVDVEYSFITGVTGAAFRFVLDEEIWNPGSYGIQGFTPDPVEPITVACESVGIAPSYFAPSTFDKDREAIVSSLNDGIPVVAFGVVGPSDAVIVTGFDDEGEILLGWSTYQDIPDDHDIPHDPTGYFRKPEWHKSLHGYVLLQKAEQAVDIHEIGVNALKRIVHIIEMPKLPGRICGLEALSAWEAILRDGHIWDVDAETFGWRYLCFSINTTMLLDQLCAKPFLDAIALKVPKCEQMIQAASDLCRQNAETIRKCQSMIPDDFSREAQENLRDSRIREEYAGLVREIHDITGELSGIAKSCVGRT